jgi:prophage regulatory protein
MNHFALIRGPEVDRISGFKKSTRCLRISEGLFLKPIKIGSRAVAWPEHEVVEINKAKIAGFTKDQIRDLVASLEGKRKELAPSV